jgi:tripeptidyl-peptidase-1
VEGYVKPTDVALQAVNTWLSQNGLESQSISPSGNRLQITLPVSKANTMFQAAFANFRHSETGTVSFQTLTYAIPSDLHDAIESLEPTSFPSHTRPPIVGTVTNMSTSVAAAACDQLVDPSCLQILYGIPTARATRQDNVLSVPGFLNSYANYADLDVGQYVNLTFLFLNVTLHLSIDVPCRLSPRLKSPSELHYTVDRRGSKSPGSQPSWGRGKP